MCDDSYTHRRIVRDARVVVDALAATFALPPEEQSAER